MTAQEAKVMRTAPLATPTDLKPTAVRDLAGRPKSPLGPNSVRSSRAAVGF
jgi:hypothetical protein